MFNINRSFVYNKALHNAFNQLSQTAPEPTNWPIYQKANSLDDIFERFAEAMRRAESMKKEADEAPNVYDRIREWADERGIYKNGDSKTQFIKLQEETGELARAILKKDRAELIDAIGDAVVVLTNLAALEGLKIEDCVESAYGVIKSRQGSMVNGTFVKNTL
jgi:NTP pyrophosphatase (non-canonical NTP hydrolase)